MSGDRSYSYPVIICAIFIIGIIGYFSYLSYSGFYSWINIMIILTLLAIYYILAFEYNPLHINPTFCSIGDGTFGVVASDLKNIGGGQYELEVDVKKRFVRKYESVAKQISGGFDGFVSFFNANYRIKIRGFESDFIKVSEYDQNCEGAFFYKRNIDSNYPKQINKELIESLKDKEFDQNKLFTQISSLQGSMAVMIQENKESFSDTAKRIADITNDVKPNQQIIVPNNNNQNQGGM